MLMKKKGWKSVKYWCGSVRNSKKNEEDILHCFELKLSSHKMKKQQQRNYEKKDLKYNF